MLDRILSGEISGDFLESETHEAEQIKSSLDSQIIGQHKAKQEIAQAISDNLHYILPKHGPLATFLFTGPTGVGKTEIAKSLANLLLGSRDFIVKISGEQFQESHSVSRLYGAPPSYVGYNDPPIFSQVETIYKQAEDAGGISHMVKRLQGFCIILIDEIEKAHPTVVQSLLGALDDGKCQLSNGKIVDLSSCIVIMTSNIGEREKREAKTKNTMGFTENRDGDEKFIMDRALKFFSPEMRGRIDSVVHFDSLTRADGLQIVEKLVRDVNFAFESFGREYVMMDFTKVNLELTQEAKELVLEKGFSEDKGARELTRAFRKLVDAPLGKMLQLHHEIYEFPQYRVMIIGDVKDGKIVFSIAPENIEQIKEKTKVQVVYLLKNTKSEKTK